MASVPTIEYTAWVEPSTDFTAKSESLDSLRKKTNGIAETVYNRVWPVGSIHTSILNTNPATTMGFGTWISYTPLAVGTFAWRRTA
jgi:hypothetical protein